MVVKLIDREHRFIPAPESVRSGRMQVVQFNRHEMQLLMQQGIIPEDTTTELLNGLIVPTDRAATGEDPSMIGNDHRICVQRLARLMVKIDGPTRHIESQQPLVCSDTHVPQPDFMILRGTLEDYTDLPTAADTWCVVEVADSSYERDAGEKLTGYAIAGVRQYIIINLRTRSAEIYTNPDTAAGTYAPPSLIASDGDLPLRVAEEETLTVLLRELLP